MSNTSPDGIRARTRAGPWSAALRLEAEGHCVRAKVLSDVRSSDLRERDPGALVVLQDQYCCAWFF